MSHSEVLRLAGQFKTAMRESPTFPPEVQHITNWNRVLNRVHLENDSFGARLAVIVAAHICDFEIPGEILDSHSDLQWFCNTLETVLNLDPYMKRNFYELYHDVHDHGFLQDAALIKVNGGEVRCDGIVMLLTNGAMGLAPDIDVTRRLWSHINQDVCDSFMDSASQAGKFERHSVAAQPTIAGRAHGSGL